MTLTCPICSEYPECPFPICYEQEVTNRIIREEAAAEHEAKQNEIDEEQLELEL